MTTRLMTDPSEMLMETASMEHSHLVSPSGSPEMDRSLKMQLSEALTEKAELEVSYMQQLTTLTQGKMKITTELKNMISTRDETIRDLQKRLDEQNEHLRNTSFELEKAKEFFEADREGLLDEMERLQKDIAAQGTRNVVSPEKPSSNGIHVSDQPEDELMMTPRPNRRIQELEEENRINAATIAKLQSELDLAKVATGESSGSPTKPGQKYGEKIRLAKSKQRILVLENQLKEKSAELTKFQEEMNSKSEERTKELQFELEAMEVAIKTLADNLNADIAGRDESILELKGTIDAQKEEISILKSKVPADDEGQTLSRVDLEEQLRVARENTEKISADAEDLRQSLESAKMIIASLEKSKKSSIDDLKGKLTASNEKIAKLEKAENDEIASAKSELEQYRRKRLEEKMATENEMASLRQEALTSLSRIDEREQEIEELKQKLEDGNYESSGGGALVSQFQSECLELNRKFEESIQLIRAQIDDESDDSKALIDLIEKASNYAKASSERIIGDSMFAKKLSAKEKEVVKLEEAIMELEKDRDGKADVEEKLKKALLENNYIKVENTFLKQDKEKSLKSMQEEVEAANATKEKITKQMTAQLQQLESAKELIKQLEEENGRDNSFDSRQSTSTMKQLKHNSNSLSTGRKSEVSVGSWRNMHESLSSLLPQCFNEKDPVLDENLGSTNSNEI
mmetsp:Transcript_26562/g.41205  ORF Transcript_26562/g.41205 Transcript_26562/m.41205 type:complete len:689 (-) Transcript_26562:252-2318(-)